METKLPLAIAIMLMNMDIMESMTVAIQAHPLPFTSPRATTRAAIPRAIITPLVTPIKGISRVAPTAMPPAPVNIKIIPLIIIKIATIVTPNGLFYQFAYKQ